MNEELQKLLTSIRFPLYIVIFLWIIKFFELISGIDLGFLGIYPRSLFGWIGILTAPLIHADFTHLASNSLPLLFIGWGLWYFYPKVAERVFIYVYLYSGMMVYLFARPNFHIGASGVIFGLAFFIFWSGIFRKDVRSMTLSLLITLFYGSMVWQVLPMDPRVSWESHLSGAIVGSILAYLYRDIDRPKQIIFDDDDDEIDIRMYKFH